MMTLRLMMHGNSCHVFIITLNINISTMLSINFSADAYPNSNVSKNMFNEFKFKVVMGSFKFIMVFNCVQLSCVPIVKIIYFSLSLIVRNQNFQNCYYRSTLLL